MSMLVAVEQNANEVEEIKKEGDKRAKRQMHAYDTTSSITPRQAGYDTGLSYALFDLVGTRCKAVVISCHVWKHYLCEVSVLMSQVLAQSGSRIQHFGQKSAYWRVAPVIV